ncbi:acyl-CoA carboxylase epsilon subunit [Paractinoplanes ferrugineus]|uniref:acyl-CoA carboxylase epsilon subunit n=1 Tax=Paractinoplanes ferrugineus TaxID=113564 RepID=UPI0019412C26|nr:acyl-CoA carboxylase epsilon subunit [Actinoplanes ferrugineus]
MDAEPLVSVVRGTPTDLELAALVTLLAARSSAMNSAPARPRPPSSWARSARPPATASGWRASALPAR